MRLHTPHDTLPRADSLDVLELSTALGSVLIMVLDLRGASPDSVSFTTQRLGLGVIHGRDRAWSGALSRTGAPSTLLERKAVTTPVRSSGHELETRIEQALWGGTKITQDLGAGTCSISQQGYLESMAERTPRSSPSYDEARSDSDFAAGPSVSGYASPSHGAGEHRWVRATMQDPGERGWACLVLGQIHTTRTGRVPLSFYQCLSTALETSILLERVPLERER